MESMRSPWGVLWGPPHIQPKKRNYVEFMWSRGVHEESMGQGKVHPKCPTWPEMVDLEWTWNGPGITWNHLEWIVSVTCVTNPTGTWVWIWWVGVRE